MKRFIKYLIMALLTFSSFGLLFYTFKLNVLNIKSFILLSMAIVFIWAILFLILLKSKKTGLKVFIGIISLLFIFVYGIGARYISKTVEYINKATNIKYETINYKVLTLKSNDINEILDLTDKNIGFMSTDKYLDKSTKKLEKRLDFEDKTYEEIGTLIGSLYEGKVEAIVVSDSYLELLEENNVEFTLEDKEVYSYSIRVIKTKEDKKVDVTKDTFIMYISGSEIGRAHV